MKTKLPLLLATSFLSLAAVSCAGQPAADDDGASEDAFTTAPSVPLPGDYDRKSAEEKQALLWDSHLATTKYRTLAPWPSVDLLGIMRLDLSISLNRTSDELPVGRKKLVHPIGSCAKVELIPDPSSPYSGMFKGGIGIARFSLASAPGTDNFTPGIGLKMFVDGMPSQNIEVMYSIDGQGKNFDFFANRFSNIIAEPIGAGPRIIGNIFKQATPFPNYLDLDSFARYDRTGKLSPTLKAPHQIFFVPTTEVKSVPRASSPTVDFRVDLAKIPSGTKIYEIVATESATAPWVRVGQVVTRSEVLASQYGDEKLFFKHEEATKAP